MVADDQAWYVIYTAPKCERQVERDLRDGGFATYLPMASRWGRLRGRAQRKRVKLIVPAYPRYVFASAFGGMDWERIHRTNGVVGIVCMGSAPARLSRVDIENVMAAEDMGCFDFMADTVRMLVGSSVMLTAGPFDGYVATVTRAPRSADMDALVTTEVALFGRATPVILPLDKIRVLA